MMIHQTITVLKPTTPNTCTLRGRFDEKIDKIIHHNYLTYKRPEKKSSSHKAPHSYKAP